MFRAFSDGTRLRILQLLRDGEWCVGDLVTVLRVPQPTASRHLAYLRKAGLVEVRKAGLWCHYRLAPAATRFHEKLLECLACCFADVPQVRADAARAAKLRTAGAGCCPEGQSAAAEARKSGCCPGGEDDHGR
jgi:ArsR family transcriptional regulator